MLHRFLLLMLACGTLGDCTLGAEVPASLPRALQASVNPTPSVSPSTSSTVTDSHAISASPSPSVTTSATDSVSWSGSPSTTPSLFTTPSMTDSISITVSFSATVSVTGTRSTTKTISLTKSTTKSASFTGSGTQSASLSATGSGTITAFYSYSSSLTGSSTASGSPSPTFTASGTPSITESFSNGASVSVTPSTSSSTSFSTSFTPSVSRSSSKSVSASKSYTSTSTGTISVSGSLSASPSITTTLSSSPLPTVTNSVTNSIAGTPTPSKTHSTTRTVSKTISLSSTFTPSVSPTTTESVSLSATVSPTISFSPTISNTPVSWSVTPSVSVSTSFSGSVSLSISVSVSVSPSVPATASATPSISISTSLSPTGTVTASETTTSTETASVTASGSVTASVSCTPTLTASDSPSPSQTSSDTMTPSLTVTVTRSASASPSFACPDGYSVFLPSTCAIAHTVTLTLSIWCDYGVSASTSNSVALLSAQYLQSQLGVSESIVLGTHTSASNATQGQFLVTLSVLLPPMEAAPTLSLINRVTAFTPSPNTTSPEYELFSVVVEKVSSPCDSSCETCVALTPGSCTSCAYGHGYPPHASPPNYCSVVTIDASHNSTSSSGGSIARTGLAIGLFAGCGAVLLALGLAALFLSRRRRSSPPPPPPPSHMSVKQMEKMEERITHSPSPSTGSGSSQHSTVSSQQQQEPLMAPRHTPLKGVSFWQNAFLPDPDAKEVFSLSTSHGNFTSAAGAVVAPSPSPQPTVTSAMIPPAVSGASTSSPSHRRIVLPKRLRNRLRRRQAPGEDMTVVLTPMGPLLSVPPCEAEQPDILMEDGERLSHTLTSRSERSFLRPPVPPQYFDELGIPPVLYTREKEGRRGPRRPPYAPRPRYSIKTKRQTPVSNGSLEPDFVLVAPSTMDTVAAGLLPYFREDTPQVEAQPPPLRRRSINKHSGNL